MTQCLDCTHTCTKCIKKNVQKRLENVGVIEGVMMNEGVIINAMS